jgi:hypothetical protein
MKYAAILVIAIVLGFVISALFQSVGLPSNAAWFIAGAFTMYLMSVAGV